MKKTFYLSFILLLFIGIESFSQQSIKTDLESEYIAKKTVNLLDNPNNYTGSPYYNAEFVNGHIYNNGDLLVANKQVRYNAFKDIFEIKNDLNQTSNIVNTISRKKSLSLKISVTEYKFIRPSEKNKVYGYLIVLVDGTTTSLYKKIKKKYTPSQEATSSMDTDIAAIYKEKAILYIIDSEGFYTEVPNSKKRKLELFNDHKKEVKSFIKEKKINIKKEKDFAKLVKFYNTL